MTPSVSGMRAYSSVSHKKKSPVANRVSDIFLDRALESLPAVASTPQKNVSIADSKKTLPQSGQIKNITPAPVNKKAVTPTNNKSGAPAEVPVLYKSLGSDKMEYKPKISPQTPPFFHQIPSERDSWEEARFHNKERHDILHRLHSTKKNNADLNNYTFAQYRMEKERANQTLRPLFQQLFEALDPDKNNALALLMFDQNQRWSRFSDPKSGLFNEIAVCLKEINASETLDFTKIKKFRQLLRGMVLPFAVPDGAKNSVKNIDALLKKYDEWCCDERNHRFLKAHSVYTNLGEFRLRMQNYQKHFRQLFFDHYYEKYLKEEKDASDLGVKRGEKPKATESQQARAKAKATYIVKKQFDTINDFYHNGTAVKGYFQALDKQILDAQNKFNSADYHPYSLQRQLYGDLREIKKLYEGIKLSTQLFADELARNNEDAWLDRKIMNRIKVNTPETLLNAVNVSPGDNTEDRFKKMLGFIMDGYGYQQMADLVRQYVNTFNDYQNIALDMAKMSSGKQVQEIERLAKARINIADQRDTFRTLREYNRTAHDAYMDALRTEHDVIGMEGEKRRMYVERMQRMINGATRDRLTDFETRRTSLLNAAMLRDAQSKVESAEQDLANQTLQSSYNVMSKQFQGSVIAETFREKMAQALMDIEQQRFNNTFDRMKKTIQSMRY